jgi:tetratricopeptide (TPR) repeat protein
VLRTAQALVASGVSNRRIAKALKALRATLPESMPLSGLSIIAVADQVVVRERGGRWQADSGQYLLEFEGDPAAGKLSIVERKPHAPEPEDWFERALELERTDPEASVRAYRQAIDSDPSHVDAWINLALLLHDGRKLNEALRVYMEALDVIGAEAVLLFNLGVLLEDMQRRKEAIQAYEGALRVDPRLADSHYNLALLHQRAGKSQAALRHMAQYRRLTASPRPSPLVAPLLTPAGARGYWVPAVSRIPLGECLGAIEPSGETRFASCSPWRGSRYAQIFRAYLDPSGNERPSLHARHSRAAAAAAIAAVASGGEIWLLDSANYNAGPVGRDQVGHHPQRSRRAVGSVGRPGWRCVRRLHGGRQAPRFAIWSSLPFPPAAAPTAINVTAGAELTIEGCLIANLPQFGGRRGFRDEGPDH